MSPGARRIAAKIGLTGRSKRTSILLFILLLIAAQVALALLLGRQLVGRAPPADTAIAVASAAPWASSAATLLFFWLAWRRFQDQDRPGWLALVPTAYAWALWILPMPLPFQSQLAGMVGLAMALALLIGLFLPPTVGPNRYGPDPRGWRSPEHLAEERRLGRAT